MAIFLAVLGWLLQDIKCFLKFKEKHKRLWTFWDMSDCDPSPFPCLETHLIGLGTGWVSSFVWFNKCLLSSFSLTSIDLVRGERLCKGSLGVDVLQEEGEPFPGPKGSLYLTLGNELSEEIHTLTKHEILLGRGAQVKNRRVREPRRTALPLGSQSRVLWW